MITADKFFDVIGRSIRNILIHRQVAFPIPPRDTDVVHDCINEIKCSYSNKSMDAVYAPFVLDMLKELTPFIVYKTNNITDLTLDVKWKRSLEDENDALFISAFWSAPLRGIQAVIQPSLRKMKMRSIKNDMLLDMTTCTEFTFTEDKVSMSVYQYNNTDLLNLDGLEIANKLYLISDVTILS